MSQGTARMGLGIVCELATSSAGTSAAAVATAAFLFRPAAHCDYAGTFDSQDGAWSLDDSMGRPGSTAGLGFETQAQGMNYTRPKVGIGKNKCLLCCGRVMLVLSILAKQLLRGVPRHAACIGHFQCILGSAPASCSAQNYKLRTVQSVFSPYNLAFTAFRRCGKPAHLHES